MEVNEENLQGFFRWATEIGISDSPNPFKSSSQSQPPSCLGQSLQLSLFPNDGGRGLAAVRELRRGEMILRVPKSGLMTCDSVLKDQKLQASFKSHSHLSSTQVLTVCLLAEVGKGRGSWWYPYLMQLPRSYDTLASFSQFEIQALQVEDAMWAAEKAILKAKWDWEDARVLMQEIKLKPQLLTFRSWLWASATISSRTLHIPWDDAGCLCPVGDFFNYAAPEGESFYSEDVHDLELASPMQASSLWEDKIASEKLNVEQLELSPRLTDGGYEEDVAAYCFYARKRYKRGEQVLLGYGTYTNLELLEHYGFLLNSNPNDKAFIQLNSEIRSSNSLPKDSMFIHQDGRPSFALLSALRLWATSPIHRRAVGHLAYSGLQLSSENEISVLKWVTKNCQDLLKKIPTTIEDDCSLLCIIDKIQNHTSHEVRGLQMLALEDEINSFFQANDLQNGGDLDVPLSNKAKRSTERWKLAVQWRLRYKKLLSDCICYCSEITDNLSDLQVTDKKMNWT